MRPGLPPFLTIHGDADPVVPYRHALLLHQALTRAGVHSELLTIPGGNHGDFSAAWLLRISAAVRAFLHRRGIDARPLPR